MTTSETHPGTAVFAAGGYRYIPAVFQYSGGVAAERGYEIRRARFHTPPVTIADGFARIAEHLEAVGRPLTAFCACELRSPGQFTESGFEAFNTAYSGTLADWGIFTDGVNPIARSNVCPEVDGPPEPVFHAFSYTVEASGDVPPTFVVAGSGECPEGVGTYEENTVRFGDTSPGAIREKAAFVHGEMERRLGLLGFGWNDTTAAQLYTIHNVHPFLADDIVARGAARAGLTWHFARPPVVGLEYEMDCRGLRTERVI
jgi:hypothetical protein